MAVMLFSASNSTATIVNRAIAGNYIDLNSTIPETTQLFPRTVVLDPSTLVKLKQDFNDGNNTMMGLSLHALVLQASSLLNKNATSVMNKRELPPSGDIHDFLSLAPYRWPDPTKKDGLPYIGRDGKTNPEIYSIPDKRNMDDMIHSVTVLAAAYYLTGNLQFASKAEELLRIWFLNNSTKMNPNLTYAETVRGKSKIYSAGVMAGRNLTDVVDAIGLIQHSSAWSNEDQVGIVSWFNQYLDWLLKSNSGKEEALKINNHGTYYYVQVSAIALFLNKTNITRNILKASIESTSSSTFVAPEKSISVKILPNGLQPFELQRTRSLDYSMFNLLGLFKLANIGQNAGVDIWNYKTDRVPLLQKALDFLLPYIIKKYPWPYSQVTQINRYLATDLLCQAIIHYPNRSGPYLDAFKIVSRNSTFLNIDNLSPTCHIS
jgi:Alginate lyase